MIGQIAVTYANKPEQDADAISAGSIRQTAFSEQN
jgi:hypothetical protein